MTVHRPTVLGRLRSDAGLLLLTALVVAATSCLAGAVRPVAERTADDAVADAVAEAASRGEVVATAPRGYADPRGETRDPQAAVELAQDTAYAEFVLPPALADVVRPGVATLTSPALHLLDEGAGRYLRLAYVDAPGGPPAVRWTAGSAPGASVGDDQAEVHLPRDAPPWPVQVGVSEAAADALGLAPGDRLPAEDVQHRRIEVVVSGVYAADDPDDETWRAVPELLRPTQGVTEQVLRTSAAALVSAAALPDLRLAVPADDLTQRVTFVPVPERVHHRDLDELGRAVAGLQTTRGDFSWDSLLGRVLDDAAVRVAGARGQATLLVVGVLAAALLLLVLAARLLVRRRAGPVGSARERGATLLGLALEVLVESALVTAAGTALGLGIAWALVGDVDGRWAAPVVVVALLAAPVQCALLAASVTDVRRVPANRSARRAAARARGLRRLVVEGAVLAATVLAVVALRQRGLTVAGRSDLTAAGAPTWWAVAGALVLLRLGPPVTHRLLSVARRSTGSVRFAVAARLAGPGHQAWALAVVTVAVAQLTFGAALAVTERDGQRDGALLAVGGDARFTGAPDPDLEAVATEVRGSRGVDAAAAGRVEDGVRASSGGAATVVRLVVLDAAAYRDLLDAGPLPDAPELERLRSDGTSVPALLAGGDPDLRDGLQVRWQDAAPVALDVVGTAPLVEAPTDPVVVVDRATLAARGLDLPPDTVWAVGPGAPAVVRAAAGADGEVTTLEEVLTARREAPLPSALVGLAAASALLLLVFALLAVALGAALGAPGRAVSVARLRALGLAAGPVRRVVAGELVLPALVGAFAGLVLGATAAVVTSGSLGLELVTGQAGPPDLVLPWWLLLVALGPALVAYLLAVVEATRLRRTPLARLLRS